MQDEGYIKFQCNWEKGPPPAAEFIDKLNHWRDLLFEKKLIGAYPDGIGYGNISIRFKANQFIISGSATGHLSELTSAHYSLVTDFDTDYNQLTCEGPIKASSESMSHGIIYQLDQKVNAVIHVHHLDLWEKLIDFVPTTSPDVAYGTPEMANEIQRLFYETDLPKKKIFVMAGHEEGIFTFGKDMEEAGEVLREYL